MVARRRVAESPRQPIRPIRPLGRLRALPVRSRRADGGQV